jgi:predicted transcriptional regulator
VSDFPILKYAKSYNINQDVGVGAYDPYLYGGTSAKFMTFQTVSVEFDMNSFEQLNEIHKCGERNYNHAVKNHELKVKKQKLSERNENLLEILNKIEESIKNVKD